MHQDVDERFRLIAETISGVDERFQLIAETISGTEPDLRGRYWDRTS